MPSKVDLGSGSFGFGGGAGVMGFGKVFDDRKIPRS